MTFRKILHPTDFTALSEPAFRAACAPGNAPGATVFVFPIAHPPALVSQDGVVTDPARGESRNLWEELKKVHGPDPSVRLEYQVIVADEKATTKQILDILD